MIEQLQTISGQNRKKISRIIEQIEDESAYEEEKFIKEFCATQEKRVNKTKAEIEKEQEELKKYMENALKRKQEIAKLEFKDKLAATIFLLEAQLQGQKSMERELAIMQKLGEQNELVKAVTEGLISKRDIKNGIEDTTELHNECNSAIRRAKLGAIVDKNTVIVLNNAALGICALLFELHGLFTLQEL